MIALSCGIKISALHYLDLSQSTRVADGQTDRITTPKAALAYARAVKIKAQRCGEWFVKNMLILQHNFAMLDLETADW